tara:strand:- start:377 stop:676 length:300 start_codon:yes stop_codon:yes gene_type:complete
MSTRLKLTNTNGVPIVLNASAIIGLYADNSDTACYVLNSNSQASTDLGSTKLAGQFTITGGSYNDFAKELNSALTSNPGGPVLQLHTEAKITNYVILPF